MTVTDDLGTDDDLGNEEGEEGQAQQRDAAYWQRQAKKAQKENADLKTRVGTFERRDALDAARRDLKAEGPIGAFLTIYDGEPTAEAIREAASKHPEFKDLITFPPGLRDTIVAEQAENAAKVAGGKGPSGQITSKDAKDWPDAKKRQFRVEHRAEWDTLMRGEPVTAPAGWA